MKFYLWNNKSDYEIYSGKVWSETHKSVKQNKKKIKNIILRSKKFHLDHKYSICNGFQNNVDPKIVGHWKNLEIIECKKNLKKFNRCSISLDKLLQEVNNT